MPVRGMAASREAKGSRRLPRSARGSGRAAKARPEAARVYLDTGTWTDLLRAPETTDAESGGPYGE